MPRHCGFDPPDSADKLGPPVGKYALLHLTEIGGGKLLLVEGNRSWLTIVCLNSTDKVMADLYQ